MTLSLLKDLNLKDAGLVRNVKPILDKIKVSESPATLDFCYCGVDYPATSLIIDKVLGELLQVEGSRKLTILFDFPIHELAIHKWFFIGSNFFQIEENNNLTYEELKDILHRKLSDNSILLELLIFNNNGEQINSFYYGSE